MTGWILFALYAIGLVGFVVRDMIEGEGAWHPTWHCLAWPVAVMVEAIEQRLLVWTMVKAWWFPPEMTRGHTPPAEIDVHHGLHKQNLGRAARSNDVWGDNLRAALTGTGPKA